MNAPVRTCAHAVDVSITGGGTLYLFELLTETAHAWVQEHVSAERQMLGRGLAVEHRYAASLGAAKRLRGPAPTVGQP